jgi:ABC-type multidrug transport system fused ATPase/permease subunit
MLKTIWQHMHGLVRVCFILAPIVMLGEVFCDLQQPTLMAKILDNGLGHGDMQYVVHTAILMLVYAIVGLVCGSGCGALANYASLHMGAKLREHMLRIALASRRIGGLEPATIITRITNDVTQMQNLVMMLTRSLVRSPMWLLGGMIMSVVVSPQLAWILFIIMPLLMAFMFYIVYRSIPLFTVAQQKIDQLNRVMRENLNGIKTIKSYVLEPGQYEQFKHANTELRDQSEHAQRSTIIMSPVIMLMLNLGVVLALYLGGHKFAVGQITDGQIIAFINYMIQITNAMINMVNTITTFSRASTSATRVRAVLDEEDNSQHGQAKVMPASSTVAFNHVSFGYQGRDDIIKDVSFEVADGQWLGIIGTTGSGKSTLINLLTKLLTDYQGTIAIGGQDIRSLQADALHDKITVAVQDSTLFSGTVADNLRYGAPEADDSALQAATATAQATDFIMTKDDGFAATVEQMGRNFSGGQRQRLNIARALTPNPDILVLDDATSAVDQTTNAQIRRALTSSRRHKTTLIISQRLTNVMDCDKIIVLQNGRITNSGTHDELMRTSKFYQQLAATQLHTREVN